MSLHPPGFIEPCLPTGSQQVLPGPQWAYEIKRFLPPRRRARRVFSRTDHDWGAQLPSIAAALRTLPATWIEQCPQRGRPRSQGEDIPVALAPQGGSRPALDQQ